MKRPWTVTFEVSLDLPVKYIKEKNFQLNFNEALPAILKKDYVLANDRYFDIKIIRIVCLGKRREARK